MVSAWPSFNAPVHRSAFTQEWKENNKITSITWPAQSSDINIIENIICKHMKGHKIAHTKESVTLKRAII